MYSTTGVSLRHTSVGITRKLATVVWIRFRLNIHKNYFTSKDVIKHPGVKFSLSLAPAAHLRIANRMRPPRFRMDAIGPWSSQELSDNPRLLRSPQEPPGALRISQELPGIPRSSRELSGALVHPHEISGDLRNPQELSR